jgi:hypothetical protein
LERNQQRSRSWVAQRFCNMGVGWARSIPLGKEKIFFRKRRHHSYKDINNLLTNHHFMTSPISIDVDEDYEDSEQDRPIMNRDDWYSGAVVTREEDCDDFVSRLSRNHCRHRCNLFLRCMYSFHVPLHSHNPSLRRDPVSGEGKTDHDLLFLLMTKLLLGEKLNEPDENQWRKKSRWKRKRWTNE